jgi:isocitrate dehydrogenase (NAD+)
MMSGAMMLDYLGELDAAARLRGAIEQVYQTGRHLTGDVGGTASTTEFTDAVIQKLG